MSRRKAFDTSLTGAGSGSKPAHSTSTTSNGHASKGDKSTQKQANGSKHLPPRVTPPRTDHPHATVPTETSEKVEVVAGAAGVADVAGNDADLDVDDNICIICAEPITFWSVGVCGHRTCHVCAVRLRIFYKSYECTFCKTVTPSLLFSKSPDVPFPAEHHVKPSPANQISAAQNSEVKLEKGKKWYDGLVLPGTLDVSKFPYGDQKLGVVFETEDLMEETLLLLRFNCPAPDCAHMALDWPSLEKHTLSEHGGAICRVCRSQLSRFAHEQVLYPPGLLGLHDPSRVPRGARPPRPRSQKEIDLVKTWDAPHPMCEFCHIAFFGPDEMFQHMKKSHEECFVCKDLGERHVYFQNFAKLEEHFKEAHYACLQPACVEQKFVVFPNEMDLRAHLVSVHGEHMSARDRAQTRQVAVGFSGHAESRRGGPTRQERPSGGRGFTMNAPHAPHAQQIAQTPLMTPDQAAQVRRQMQTDRQEESKRRKGFNTDLTGSHREQQSLANGGEGSRSGFATPREDVDDATAARHAALLSRISLLVNDSPNKLSSFRSAVRQYRNNESGAKDLVDTIFNILDEDIDATMSVLREISTLFAAENDNDKNKAVLEALNGFRVAQREQFPALANAPTGLGSEWAGITSGRILNAKRATHTINRGGSARTVWDRVEAAASSTSAPTVRATAGANGRYVPGATARTTSMAFPSLAGPSASQTKSSTHSTPWASGGAGSSSKAPPALTGPVVRSVNFNTGPSKTKPLNNSAFPSLPPSSGKSMSAAERQALFNKPNAREETIRRIRGSGQPPPPPVTNGWGASGNDLAAGVEVLDVNEDSPAPAAGGGKKKGKQKQLLFTVSARPS